MRRDFNGHSVKWRYKITNTDGTALGERVAFSGLTLLYDPKQSGSFRSPSRWRYILHPLLAFFDISGLTPRRIILDRFFRSQHKPSLISFNNP